MESSKSKKSIYLSGAILCLLMLALGTLIVIAPHQSPDSPVHSDGSLKSPSECATSQCVVRLSTVRLGKATAYKLTDLEWDDAGLAGLLFLTSTQVRREAPKKSLRVTGVAIISPESFKPDAKTQALFIVGKGSSSVLCYMPTVHYLKIKNDQRIRVEGIVARETITEYLDVASSPIDGMILYHCLLR